MKSRDVFKGKKQHVEICSVHHPGNIVDVGYCIESVCYAMSQLITNQAHCLEKTSNMYVVIRN